MSEVRKKYDDEIDLFELFRTFWDGKWLICTFAVLITTIGFVYLQVAQPVYSVSIPYKVNAYSVSIQQMCASDSIEAKTRCMELRATKQLVSLLDDGWDSNLSLLTKSPLGTSEYIAKIERANLKLTNEIYIEAKAELAIIQTGLSDALLSTERVATDLLNAKRIVQTIDNGQSAVSFGSVSIVKSSPKVPSVLGSSLILGTVIGLFSVLVRKAQRNRKELLIDP